MKYALACILVLGSFFALEAQEFVPLDVSPMDMTYYPQDAPYAGFAKTEEEKRANQPQIRLIYSRPLRNDRDLWGNPEMIPYEKPYRLGANENTEIEFYRPFMLGDQIIPPGRYTLGVIPKEGEWMVFINTDVDTWGVYGYQPEKNLATSVVKTTTSEEDIEALSMVFYLAESGLVHLKIGWGNTLAEVPFKPVE